jgi:DNA-directed RNA polymerase beta subunit
MSQSVATTSRVPNNLRFRRSFGHIKKIIDIPNLIDIQKRSYEEFLQRDVAPDQRKEQGLQAVFKSVFPIKDFNETASLEFVSYTLSDPKYDVDECHQRGMTYAAPLKVTVQLVIWDVDPESGARSIKNVKEQEVYFGEIPLMTQHGTFMVYGTERVMSRSSIARPASSSTTTRARRTRAASSSTRPASSRTEAPGSTSSSTRATSCTSASTGAGSSTRRSCCAPSA